MYQSPKLLRHGSFREMTQAGIFSGGDHLFFKSLLPPVNNTPPDEDCPPTGQDAGSR